MRIVHISDLHLSSIHYVSEWGERVINLIDSMDPEVLVVTGDLTDFGYAYEYDVVRQYFDNIGVKNIIVVPGNHDARNKGYDIFEELFQTRYPQYQNDIVSIFGIDSSEPDIDDGHIGRENYLYIEREFQDEDRIKVLALHHHLIPIPGTGRERQIPVDAGDALKLCNKLNINFVLSGHRHRQWIWKLEDTYFITAGTATTRRLKGRSYPSFNVIDINGDFAILNEVNVENESTKEILNVKI